MKTAAFIAFQVVASFDLAPIRSYENNEEAPPLRLRLEILRDIKDSNRYTARLWKAEFFDLKPSFQPRSFVSTTTVSADEQLLVEDSSVFPANFLVVADSLEEAQKEIMRIIEDRFALGN